MTRHTPISSAHEPSTAAGASPIPWTAEQVARIAPGSGHVAPVIRMQDVAPHFSDLGIWDAWPVSRPDGTAAVLPDGGELWMALGAPWFEDPEERHGHARIHLFHHRAGAWRHMGPALPDGFSPGSREWSGSAVLEDSSDLTFYFTATGRRGEAALTFEQRLIVARARLSATGGTWRFVDWQPCRDIVIRNPEEYMAGDDGGGAVGTIKAFRDPFFFHDPAGSGDYIFFAGSSARQPSAYNGVVGVAARRGIDAAWGLRPPMISAIGLNNELERPHMLWRDGWYYLFWSTQSHVFNPEGPKGPTGLYGMASPSLDGGWQPLNGTGLVFCNPPEAPRQAYSWLVMPDLSVTSFADHLAGGETTFAGTFAPFLRLRLDGAAASLAG